jgi:hypothetical protein
MTKPKVEDRNELNTIVLRRADLDPVAMWTNLTREGAVRLANQIRTYWRRLGYPTIKTHAERMTAVGAYHGELWQVRSSLKPNGLPSMHRLPGPAKREAIYLRSFGATEFVRSLEEYAFDEADAMLIDTAQDQTPAVDIAIA